MEGQSEEQHVANVSNSGGERFQHIRALDKNWYDFVRTDPNSDGGEGGGLIGEQFKRPVFNVDGGIGFFASAAVDSVGFTVNAP